MGSWDTHWNSLSGGSEIKDHKGRVGGESRELPWIQQEAGAGGSGGLGGGTMEHGPSTHMGAAFPQEEGDNLSLHPALPNSHPLHPT